MAIDFTKPATTDNYSTAFVTNIQGNQTALAQWLDSSNVTITGTPPTFAKRYNRTSSAVEEWGGAAWSPIKFHGLTIDAAAGNLGLGATPSSWTGAGGQSLEVGRAGNSLFGSASVMDLICNANYSSGWKYTNAGLASYYEQTAGVHGWYTAPSGTAGAALTWTKAMTLDASGNLGIGVASPTTRLDVRGVASNFYSGAAGTFSFVNVGRAASELRIGVAAAANDFLTGVVAGDAVFYNVSTGNSWYGTSQSAAAILTTNNAERMRIDSVGNVGIGVSSPGAALDVQRPGNTELRLFGTTAGATNKLIFANNTNSSAIGNGSGGELIFYAASAVVERMRIDATGTLGLGLTPVSSGNNRALVQLQGSVNGGVYLGNTANAATNALDWYEEGTVTPSLTFGGASVGMTYGSQTGRFTRIGNKVHLWIRIGLTSKGSSAGVAAITGLPYTGSSAQQQVCFGMYSGMTGLAAEPITIINAGGTVMLPLTKASGTNNPSSMLDTSFTNTSSVDLNFWYEV